VAKTRAKPLQRARAPAPACGPRPVVDRALRAGPAPTTTTAPPPRHAPECETLWQGRADPLAGRSVGPSVPCARSAAVGRGRRTTTAVLDAAYPAHINTHPRPRATTPFAPTTLFFNNNIVYYYCFFLFSSLLSVSPTRDDSNKRVNTNTQVYCNAL